MAKRISIINFKGGVGKTTLSFHLATGLASGPRGKKVLLVDVDHQSSLSVLCLGVRRWKQADDNKRTVTEIFREFVGLRTNRPSDEIIVKRPLSGYPRLDIVPASLDLDEIEILLTSSQRGDIFHSEWDKRTSICRWIERTRKTRIDEEYDYIIFDCPPATKIVSQNAIAASHGYVIPVVPEAVMHRGTGHLISLIENSIDRRLRFLRSVLDVASANNLAEYQRPSKIHVPVTKLVGLVVTRIDRQLNEHAGNIRILESEPLWRGKILRPYIEEGVGVSEALTKGVPVYNDLGNPNVTRRGFPDQYAKLTAELKKGIDRL